MPCLIISKMWTIPSYLLLLFEIEEALEKSYKSIDAIHFDKMNYRKDIGFDLV